jgi:hypothetical protein
VYDQLYSKPVHTPWWSEEQTRQFMFYLLKPIRGCKGGGSRVAVLLQSGNAWALLSPGCCRSEDPLHVTLSLYSPPTPNSCPFSPSRSHSQVLSLPDGSGIQPLWVLLGLGWGWGNKQTLNFIRYTSRALCPVGLLLVWPWITDTITESLLLPWWVGLAVVC